jgi:hypothetical protein
MVCASSLSQIFRVRSSGATAFKFRTVPLMLGFAAAVTMMQGCFGLITSNSESPEYGITTNEQLYSRGNTGEATIRNTSSKPLEYNLCPRRLEREVNNYWVVAFEWPTAGGTCPSGTRTLAKGETVNALFEIPTGVPMDRYRIVFNGLLGKDLRALSAERTSTPVFEVR